LEENETKFYRLMKRLSEANLFLQSDKCEFLKSEVIYLGHIITENGARPDLKKIIAVKNFLIPKTRKNIKQFLGLAGYYRRFIDVPDGPIRSEQKFVLRKGRWLWEKNKEYPLFFRI